MYVVWSGGQIDQLRRRETMKRVFISILVFAITSTASASLQIMVDGDKSDAWHVGHADYSLGIWTDTDIVPVVSDNFYYALVCESAYCNIDYTTGVVVPADDGLSIEHTMDAVSMGFPLDPGDNGLGGGVALFNLSKIAAGSVLFDQIDFHISWPFPIPVKLYETYDWTSMTLVDTVYIAGIPEPMTICLFSLGALLLRKKK
jgi:hypothetical protein